MPNKIQGGILIVWFSGLVADLVWFKLTTCHTLFWKTGPFFKKGVDFGVSK